MTNPTACREAFEKYCKEEGFVIDRWRDGYIGPLNDIWLGWQAAWNTRPTEGEAVAWRVTVEGCDPQFVSDPQFFRNMDSAGVRYTKEPLYTQPRATSGEVERDAARYRWAKDNRWPTACPTGYYLSDGVIYPSEDQAIDAAIKRGEK